MLAFYCNPRPQKQNVLPQFKLFVFICIDVMRSLPKNIQNITIGTQKTPTKMSSWCSYKTPKKKFIALMKNITHYYDYLTTFASKKWKIIFFMADGGWFCGYGCRALVKIIQMIIIFLTVLPKSHRIYSKILGCYMQEMSNFFKNLC